MQFFGARYAANVVQAALQAASQPQCNLVGATGHCDGTIAQWFGTGRVQHYLSIGSCALVEF